MVMCTKCYLMKSFCNCDDEDEKEEKEIKRCVQCYREITGFVREGRNGKCDHCSKTDDGFFHGFR